MGIGLGKSKYCKGVQCPNVPAEKERPIMINPYIIHILGRRALNGDVIDMPGQSAAIICNDWDNEYSDAAGLTETLFLYFSDVDSVDSPGAFRMDHAERIIRFLRGLPIAITDLYICCAAGESRSPAIAAAILRASGRSDRDVWMNPFYHPNILVYKTLCKAFGIENSIQDIETRILLNKDAFKAAQDNHGKSKYERWQILE